MDNNISLPNELKYYKPKFEDGIKWNDKDLKIKWPIEKPTISAKDKKLGM